MYLSVFLGSICVIAVVSGRTLAGRRYPRRSYSEDDSTVTMKPSLCTHIASCQHRPEKFSKLAMNKFSVQSTRLARDHVQKRAQRCTLETGPTTAWIAAIPAMVLKLCLETDSNILKIAACHETFALDDRSFAWLLSGLLQVRPRAHVFPFDSKVLASSRGIMHRHRFAMHSELLGGLAFWLVRSKASCWTAKQTAMFFSVLQMSGKESAAGVFGREQVAFQKISSVTLTFAT